MALLGRSYHRPQRQLVTAFGPANYTDLLVIPRADLPSGTGSGKDYAVVVFAQVGPLWCSGGFDADCLFRIGLRYPFNSELAHTWSDFYFPHHLMFLRGRAGNELSHYVCIVTYIRDFPTTHDLHLSAQHTAPQFFAVETQVQDIVAMVFDCTAFGGSRDGTGWLGSRLSIKEMAAGTNPFVNHSLLGRQWGVASVAVRPSQRMTFEVYSPEGRSSIFYQNRAPAFSDRQDYICHGTWACVEGSNQLSANVTDCVALGGWSLAIKLDTLDNAAKSTYTSIDLNGIGRSPGNSDVTREYGLTTTRPASDVVQLVRATADFRALGAGGIPRAVAGHALQNGWTASGTPLADRTGSFGLLGDWLPIHAGARTPAGYTVPEGGAMLATDRFALPDFVGTQTVSPILHVQAVQFSLSDFGPIAAPPPVTFTDVELVPGYEADLDLIPAIAAPMRAVSPYDGQATGARMLTAGQYEIRHGGPTRERLSVQVVGESLTLADAELLRQQADTAQPFKMALDDGVMRAWRFVPGSLGWSEAGNGLVTVSAVLIEHPYLAP